MAAPFPVALVGVGKIARDQHIPAIVADPDFELAAAVSRNASVDGVPGYADLDRFLAEGPPAVVALCVPPDARTAMALKALAAGRDVLLEKPPAATLGEVDLMVAAARERGAVLFATWHSRFAPAVADAKAWLAKRRPRSVSIVWKEDVRRWHPNQAWIWQAGGFGVFDPGINALSIATEILPHELFVEHGTMDVPAGRASPLAASIAMRCGTAPVQAEFDFLQTGPQTWSIEVDTDAGTLRLGMGGSILQLPGEGERTEANREYPRLYARFADLIAAGRSDIDVRPLRLVSDAFLVAERRTTSSFSF